MKTFPQYPLRKIFQLDGLWDFKFLDDIEIENIDPFLHEFDNIMCVPGAFDCSPDYYCKRGVAIYRTEFNIDADCKNSLLKSGGIGLRGRFWIDNREIGFTNLPYSGIEFAGGHLSAGKHEFYAAIDNRMDPDKMKLFLPAYDFYAFGGFYRSIELHILPDNFYIDRIQVRTADYKKGKVGITFLFKGNVPAEEKVLLRFNTEKDFRQIDLSIIQGRAQIEMSVPDFQLWSVNKPALHTLEVKTVNDYIIESFGIREIKTGNRILLLNGEPVYLKGFNRHESHPGFGPAIPEQLLIEDLQNLKAMNCNFVRGCHYPQDQRFLDLCDRTGLLVWEESLGWGNTAEQMADPEFISLQEQQTRFMVRNSINHPSIIIWAFLNEFHSQTGEGRDICKKLVTTIKKEDSSRLVTFACNHTGDDTCFDLVDIISYNTYPGWISNDNIREPVDEIAPDRDKIIKYFRSCIPAGKPILISEMGCCGVYGEHDRAYAQWTEDFQAEYLAEVIKRIFDSAEICGLTIWQLNDAKSYLRKGANIRCKPFALNLAGVFDQYRRPKLAVKVVQTLFRNK